MLIKWWRCRSQKLRSVLNAPIEWCHKAVPMLHFNHFTFVCWLYIDTLSHDHPGPCDAFGCHRTFTKMQNAHMSRHAFMKAQKIMANNTANADAEWHSATPFGILHAVEQGLQPLSCSTPWFHQMEAYLLYLVQTHMHSPAAHTHTRKQVQHPHIVSGMSRPYCLWHELAFLNYQHKSDRIYSNRWTGITLFVIMVVIC